MSKNKDKVYKAIRALIFTIICFFGLLIIGQGFIQMDGGRLAAIKCGQYYDLEKDSLDVLVVGASSLKCGYSPNVMYENSGIVSYERGTSAMPPSLFYYSVKEALKTQHPSVILVDGGQLFKNYDYTDEKICRTLNANLDFCHLNKDKVEAAFLVSSIAESEKVPNILFPMLEYHNRWETITYKEFSTAIQTPYDQLLGQTPYWKSVPQDPLLGHMDIEDSADHRQFNEEGVESYTKMINLCKEKGIPIVLCRTPRAGWSQADSDSIREFAEKAGAGYLEMNTDEVIQEMGIDPKEDFDDAYHLNYKGSTKMTKWLGKYFLENYDIDTSDTTASTKAQMEKNVKYYHEYVAENTKD